MSYEFAKKMVRYLANSIANKDFYNGYELGKEDGIREGMTIKYEQGVGVSDEEYKEVCKFLAERNLEINYSVSYEKGHYGAQIRKHIPKTKL